MSAEGSPCPGCGSAHEAPEAWLAPLRDGDAHAALEALPVQRFAEGACETFRALREVPPLAPWGVLGHGGAQCFYVAEGVVASALDGPDRWVLLGARCPRAMERALRRSPPWFVARTQRQRRALDSRPWHVR